MSEEDITKIEDLMVKAIQSTKRENSGLIDDVKTAHGKIMEEIQNIKNEQTKQWEEVRPMLEVFNDVKSTKKVLKFILIGLTLIIGFFISIKTLLNK
jgi:hypothetical protein